MAPMKDYTDDGINDKTALMSDDEKSPDKDYTSDSFAAVSSVDQIVDSLNVGLFHYLIITACGLGYAGYIIYIQTLSLIVITACELNITTANKGWLSINFMIGLVASSSIFGRLADVYGRRKIVLITIFFNLVCSVASAFAYNYLMLVIMSGLIGCGYGGVNASIHSYVLEFFPRRYRGKAGGCMSGFLILGSVFGALVALAILPRSFNTHIGGITFTSWRIYLLITQIPSVIIFLMLLAMPKSLRFVLVKQDKKSAHQVLDKINQINSLCQSNQRKLKHHVELDWEMDLTYRQEENTFVRHIRKLLTPPWRKRLILLSIAWFGYCIGDQGFAIWLPTIISFYVNGNTCRYHPHYYHNKSISLNVIHHVSSNFSHCTSGEKLYTVAMNILIGNVLSIPIALLCILLINRLGRKWLYCSMASICALCILMILFIDTLLSTKIISIIFLSFTVNVWIPFKIWSSELFCTEIRSTAVGILSVTGHIGSILGIVAFIVLFHVSCTATLILFSMLGFLIAFTTLFLPDTTDADIK